MLYSHIYEKIKNVPLIIFASLLTFEIRIKISLRGRIVFIIFDWLNLNTCKQNKLKKYDNRMVGGIRHCSFDYWPVVQAAQKVDGILFTPEVRICLASG